MKRRFLTTDGTENTDGRENRNLASLISSLSVKSVPSVVQFLLPVSSATLRGSSNSEQIENGEREWYHNRFPDGCAERRQAERRWRNERLCVRQLRRRPLRGSLRSMPIVVW